MRKSENVPARRRNAMRKKSRIVPAVTAEPHERRLPDIAEPHERRRPVTSSVIAEKRQVSGLWHSAAVFACVVIMAGAIAAGYYTAPEDTRIPVMLANGEVIMQPCYVAVNGECIALVSDEEVAEEVVNRVKDEYKNAATTSVEIEEETSIKNMELENGADKPEILTARQASEKIVNAQTLTVKTTEVIEEVESVKYKIIEKESDKLNLGEVKVQQEGQSGRTRVMKKVIKENGVVVSEQILQEKVLKESVPEIVINGTAGLVCPLEGFTLTSEFGPRWGRQHSGLDMALAEGSPVYAAKEGIVTWAGYKDSYGNLVKIDHGDGMETYYAHCSRLDVTEGQQIQAGQQIAAVGSTGNSTGPHLHFEVRVGGIAQDPADWLDIN